MNDIEKKINNDLNELTNEIGNKGVFIGTIFYFVTWLFQSILFFKYIKQRSLLENVIEVSLVITLLLFTVIFNLKTHFKSKIIKYIYLFDIFVVSIIYMYISMTMEDAIIAIFVMLVGVCYFDWKYSLVIGILINIITVSGIYDAIKLGNLYSELWKNYNLIPAILAVFICSIIISLTARKYLFNKIKDHLTKENEQKELMLANRIQSGFLEDNYIENKIFEVSATMFPSKEVGGDFYDFFMKDPTKLVILVADVSGKGVPASLFMATAKNLLYVNIQKSISFEKALEETNRMLIVSNPEMQFVTMFVAEIDLSNGKVYYINAGHNKPFIVRKDGRVEQIISTPDFILGVKKVVRYHSKEIKINVGDKLFLYTDGLTERFNEKKELFGKDRLINLLRDIHDKQLKEYIPKIKTKLDEYAGNAKQNDDITFLTFEYKKARILEPRMVKKFDGNNMEHKDVMNFLNESLLSKNVPEQIISLFKVSTDEIVSNILKYAYENDNVMKDVRISIQVVDNVVRVAYIDNGKYYNPLNKVDGSKTTKVTEKSKIGGLGIITVWNIMDDMQYSRFENYNMLTLIKEY